MKIYISTPINARGEKTFALRYSAAKKRVEELKKILSARPEYRDAQFISTFDINQSGGTEQEALGKCVQAVLECDMLFYDIMADGFEHSKGCGLEMAAAHIYGIPLINISA